MPNIAARILSTLLVLTGALCALGVPARAELWQSAEPLPEQAVSFGGFLQIYGPAYALPAAFTVFGQFSFGQTRDLTLESDIGLGMIDSYIGFFGKYRLLGGGDAWTASVRAGLHRQINFYVDGSLIISRPLGAVEFYFAPVIEVPLGALVSGTPPSVGVVPGVSFAFSRGTRMYLEGDIDLYNRYFAGSAGLSARF